MLVHTFMSENDVFCDGVELCVQAHMRPSLTKTQNVRAGTLLFN